MAYVCTCLVLISILPLRVQIGAFRIYVLILKPYFERNENEIDKLVATSVSQVQTSVGGYLQNLLYHLVIESNKSFLSSLLTAQKPVDNSANDVVIGGLKSALTMLNSQTDYAGACAAAEPHEGNSVRASARKGHRHGHGHVNLLLEFCHLLQEGVVVASPKLEFSRSGAGWCASLREERGAKLEPCVLLLNCTKNVLMVRYQGDGAAALQTPSQPVSAATGLCIALWNVSQVSIDEVEPDQVDQISELSSPKSLLIDTLRPVSSFKTTGGATQFHKSGVSSLVVMASGVGEVTVDSIAEGNELLDSMGYGLPMLIQQYKANVSKRWGRLDKLLVKKLLARNSIFKFSPEDGVVINNMNAKSDAKAQGVSMKCDRGAKEATAQRQRNMSSSFLMWKLTIGAGVGTASSISASADAKHETAEPVGVAAASVKDSPVDVKLGSFVSGGASSISEDLAAWPLEDDAQESWESWNNQ